MRRPNIFGRGQALNGDLTTSGAQVISTLPSNARTDGRGMVRRDDPTTVCPKCGRPGVVAEGESKFNLLGKPIALDGHLVSCGCPPGSNRIIAPLGELSSSSTTAAHSSAEQFSPSGVSPTPIYDEQFILQSLDGIPLPDMPYKITAADGTVFRGTTDRNGRTERVVTKEPQRLTIEPDMDGFSQHNPEV